MNSSWKLIDFARKSPFLIPPDRYISKKPAALSAKIGLAGTRKADFFSDYSSAVIEATIVSVSSFKPSDVAVSWSEPVDLVL